MNKGQKIGTSRNLAFFNFLYRDVTRVEIFFPLIITSKTLSGNFKDVFNSRNIVICRSCRQKYFEFDSRIVRTSREE